MWDEVSQINTIYQSLNMDFSMEDLDLYLERWAKCVSPGYQYHTCQLLLISGDIQQAWCWLRHWERHKNGRHFTDDIFKRIFFNENVWIWIKVSLQFVPMSPINNIPALVQIMAWHRPGDKPWSEPMLVSLPTHICVTCPQWVNQLKPGHGTRSSLALIMSDCLCDAKPLPEPMLTHYQ